MITVPVPLGERSYDVLVGRGVRSRLPGVLPDGARRAAIVTQAAIPWWVDPGIEHETFLVAEGEDAKTLGTIEDLCRRFSRWGLTRSDVVIGVGGGMVTDVAGLAAAVYHRGLPVVHVATTLLGQIDAAIGGKTGVNLPEGKNLVGAFWQPHAVLCDTEMIDTLPPAELRSGLGEIAKYHFLDDAGRGRDLAELSRDEQVAACVEIKAASVAADEREGGRRALLNYGHTLAHAIETAGRHGLRHGEAVGVGLVFAAVLARRVGRIDDERVAEHRRVVSGFGLPARIPDGLADGRLIDLMRRDKKATAGLTFILDGPDGVEVVTGVPEDAVRDALAAMKALE